ncbi:hypothetical protein BKI52_44260 [marine bacterium AO1-C]|nr:hypothetical protein BKI52_44260 [marine bacterium AO1-C]
MAKRTPMEVNAGSMADISFLLLIFFLVTTQIPNEKGLPILLPPKRTGEIDPVKLKDRNVLTVIVNSKNQLLVEREPLRISDLQQTTIDFLENEGRDPESSDSPQKAVVSIKTDRGTSYDTYLKVMDKVQAAYNTLRAKHMDIPLAAYLAFDKKKASKTMKDKYEAAKKAYPLRISEAEQSTVEK